MDQAIGPKGLDDSEDGRMGHAYGVSEIPVRGWIAMCIREPGDLL